MRWHPVKASYDISRDLMLDPPYQGNQACCTWHMLQDADTNCRGPVEHFSTSVTGRLFVRFWTGWARQAAWPSLHLIWAIILPEAVHRTENDACAEHGSAESFGRLCMQLISRGHCGPAGRIACCVTKLLMARLCMPALHLACTAEPAMRCRRYE